MNIVVTPHKCLRSPMSSDKGYGLDSSNGALGDLKGQSPWHSHPPSKCSLVRDNTPALNVRRVKSQQVQQTFLLQLQFIIQLPPHSQPAIAVLRMRHRLILPNPIEIPSTTLSLSVANTLHALIWTSIRAQSRVHNRITSLLGVDAKRPGQ